MFCNRCGAEIQLGSLFCAKCVRRIGDPVSVMTKSRLERHLQTLGTLWMSVGGLFLIPAVAIMVFGHGVRWVVHNHEPWPDVVQFLIYVAGGSLTILAAGGVCVGLGLIQRRPWARISAIILGGLALFHPPFGTALGVYTLWVLLADEHGEQYRYLTDQT